MKIYLMARYSKNADMRLVAKSLCDLGHEVVSRWIKGNHQVSDELIAKGEITEFEQRIALEDVEDLYKSDLCIGFSEPPRTLSRGGRHVELGMAIALGKRIIVVGGREHVFHSLSQIEHVKTIAELYQKLT